MNTDPTNIIKGFQNIITANIVPIDNYIKEYQGDSSGLSLFIGKRATLPLSNFPSLEMEALDGDEEFVTTETIDASYNIEFTLTISVSSVEKSLEYMTGLTRLILACLTLPFNRGFQIPYEKRWNPQTQSLCPAVAQFSQLGGVTYNSNKEGTVRVANWTMTVKVLEGLHHYYPFQPVLEQNPEYPFELPPEN